jgi:hypothetical protein
MHLVDSAMVSSYENDYSLLLKLETAKNYKDDSICNNQTHPEGSSKFQFCGKMDY